MWFCPFLIGVTDRRSAEKEGRNKKKKELRSCQCLYANAHSSVGAWGWPMSTDVFSYNLPLSAPLLQPLPVFILVGWCNSSYHLRMNPNSFLFTFHSSSYRGSSRQPSLVSSGWWVSNTHAIQAWVCIIIMDNGCGSPLTRATTGSADKQSPHKLTMHVHAKPAPSGSQAGL